MPTTKVPIGLPSGVGAADGVSGGSFGLAVGAPRDGSYVASWSLRGRRHDDDSPGLFRHTEELPAPPEIEATGYSQHAA